ncbi:MAG: sulfurtransferase TusA family protein [Alphaproteobacteria bacterium]|nr:sulfurtransferase TusA family protein [Alphaproteobacteria bacterium]
MSERDGETVLDLTGLLCPLPVLKAGKRLAGMAPGAVLTVIATDPMAEIDMAHFCRERGYLLMEQSREGQSFIFRIARP